MEEELEITAKELKRLIDSGTQVTLIDVREQSEYEICHINGSRLMPVRPNSEPHQRTQPR